MFKNYLTIAIRNLMRHKVYSMINIAGLAIGIACAVLLLLYIQHELSYDQFHKNADRIYQVVRETRSKDGNTTVGPGTSGPLGPALLEDFPEIETTVRTMNNFGWVRSGDRGFNQGITLADAHILDLFRFPLLQGNRETVFREPYSTVITESMAQKFFGDEDPLGKVITVDQVNLQGDYTVTGVLQDFPGNSSIRFDFLISTVPSHEETQRWWNDWQRTYFARPAQTYAVLREGADPGVLEKKLPEFMARHLGEDIQKFNTYYLQPLTRIHLYSNVDYGFGAGGDIEQIYLYAVIASIILLIACINFMNLATARASNRAREVGIRKVVGSYRRQLIQQFLGESLLLSFLAMILALVLTGLALPKFNNFMFRDLSLTKDPLAVLPSLVGITLIVGLLAGSYPAFFLSAFQPVEVLKGGVISRGVWFRKGLVVCQFALSILFVISTVVVYNQLMYLSNKKLGFNEEHLVTMPIFTHNRFTTANREDRLSFRYNVVKQTFLQHPNVLKVTAYRYPVGIRSGALRAVRPEGVRGSEWRIRVQEIDEDFLDTFEIELIAGRNFASHDAIDYLDAGAKPLALLLNEAAVKHLGWTGPVGKQIEWIELKWAGTVVGVVKDFHSQSLREEIGPLAFIIRPSNFWNVAVRIRGEDIPKTLTFLEEKWGEFVPDRPFNFAFVDEQLDQIYQAEIRFGQITGVFSALAIFVASLGLFGLVSFTAEQRRKEIGVRKVLGASAWTVIVLLSKEFLKLVGVANLIAWPVAYLVMSDWLQDFAYRVTLGPTTFLLASILVLGIALATVSSQAIKAARENPVDALRVE